MAHLVTAMPLDELRRRLRATDAAILDMDGCLHWGITQAIAVLGLIRRLALRPDRPEDRRFLPSVLLSVLRLSGRSVWYRRARPEILNRALIDLWCETFRGVPMTYFRSAVKGIPRRSFPGVRRTIERLADQGPVGIISVGLELVVHEYVRQFQRPGRPLITFHRGNRMVIEVRDGRMVFAGRYAEPMLVSPADKAAAGRHFLDTLGAKRPLVVGNDEGDTPLARLAQERGGLAIGIQPPPRLRRLFDAYLTRGDWSPLADLLA